MKVGTITVHNGYNYGASLQAYSLIEYLRENSIEAYLIDYRNPFIELKSKSNENPFIHKIKYYLFNGKAYALRRKKFDKFHDEIIYKKTRNVIDKNMLEALNKEFDAFICGSDQIWNPDITDYDSTFFLNFVNKSKIRIAYAPSLGTIKKENEPWLSQNLANIDYLSIREFQNKDIIERLAGRKCEHVLDPVFLLTAKSWDTICDTIPRLIDKKYILYYTLHEDTELFKKAKDLSKEMGIPLIRVDINPIKARIQGCKSVSNLAIGPIEFLNLIKYSEAIVTNSFHGTAFSIIFKKIFYVSLLHGSLSGKNSRVQNLLKSLNLEKCIVNEKYNFIKNDYNWDEIENKLSVMRQNSQKYLKNALLNKQE